MHHYSVALSFLFFIYFNFIEREREEEKERKKWGLWSYAKSTAKSGI